MKSPFLTEEHQEFRKIIRLFTNTEIVPYADEWEQSEAIPKEIWCKMAEQNLLGINHPKEFGGSDNRFFYSVVYLEEIARCGMGGFSAAIIEHQYHVMACISKFGDKGLKDNYLVPGIMGQKIGAFAIAEKNSGSDVAAWQTQAEKNGDNYILNGAKSFVVNGMYGDFFIVAAKTLPTVGEKGISLFLVDSGTQGIVKTKLKKLGCHCSDTADIELNNVKVPKENLLGSENMGYSYIMDSLQLECLAAAISSVAAAEYCIESSVAYTSKRQVISGQETKFQTTLHALSDLGAELEAARQLTYYACWQHDQGIQDIKVCSMAKLNASELAKKITDACLQYFSDDLYLDKFIISRLHRDARVNNYIGGASDTMRENIAKLLLDDAETGTGQEEDQTSLEEKLETENNSSEKTLNADLNSQINSNNLEEEKIDAVGGVIDLNNQDGNETGDNSVSAPSPGYTKENKKLPGKSQDPFEDLNLGHFIRGSANDQETSVDNGLAEGDFSEEGKSEMAKQSTGRNKNNSQQDKDEMDNLNKSEEFITSVPAADSLTVESIINSLPERFKSDRADKYCATFHFNISGSGGGQFTVTIDENGCRVEKGLNNEANCLVETAATTYIEMETGKTNPQIAFMMGKVKITNVPELMQFVKLFRKIPDI